MRSLALPAVLMAMTMALPAVAQKNAPRHSPQATATEARAAQLSQAEAAMDHEQWPDAEAILRKLTAANNKDTQAWFDLGYTMHAQGNYSEAIAAYRAAVLSQPQSFECNLNLGLMLAHEHRAEAVTVLENTVLLKPTGEHPQQALARAWSALAEVREPDAKAVLAARSRAAELDASLPNLLALSVAFERVGDAAAAEQEARKAASLAPGAPEPQAVLANLYMRAKRLPEAEAALRKVLAARPNDEDAHFQLGRVLSAEEKYEDATPELQKALALRGSDWEAVRELAFVCAQRKKWPEAEAQYRALTAQFPGDAEAHDGLGAALMAQLKYAEARDEFILALQRKPAAGDTWGRLAMALAGNQQYEAAIKAMDERHKYLVETPSTYFLRATYYDHLRQYPEAVQNYKAFLAISNGQFPDEEWKARHRLIAIEPEARKKK